MPFTSHSQQLVVALAAGLLIGVPTALRSSPDQSAAPKRNTTEARLATLEATSKKLIEAVGTLSKLSEDQTKSLEEADLRLGRIDKQLGDFAGRSALRELETSVASLKNDDLRRKVESLNNSDVDRKIDSVRNELNRMKDRQNELDRIGSKHEDRLNKLESKG